MRSAVVCLVFAPDFGLEASGIAGEYF